MSSRRVLGARALRMTLWAVLSAWGLFNAGMARAQGAKGENYPVEPGTSTSVRFAGQLRLLYTTLTPERFFGIRTPSGEDVRRNPNVGRNDGFVLNRARLNMRATLRDDIAVRLGFEGAAVRYEDLNSPIGQLGTMLTDAYAHFHLDAVGDLFAGRFRPPWDIESLTPPDAQLFVQRALESVGVAPQEGYSGDMAGFSVNRQLGLMMSNDAAFWLNNTFFGYAVALTNGANAGSGDANLNDNDLPALFLRATWGYNGASRDPGDEQGPATYGVQEGGLIGLGVLVDEQTFGNAPNRFRSRVVGLGLDAAFTFNILTLQGQLLVLRREHLLLADSRTERGIGGHAQIAALIPHTNLRLGYRFAVLNPRWVPGDNQTSDTADYDRVMHHTIGIRYTPAQLPVVFWADFTSSLEQQGRVTANDRVQLAMQASFE